MDESNDPRVYFAAERTLLAWVRTGIGVIGLGFVVARFGLFLRLLRHDASGDDHAGSTVIGVGLVLLGVAAVAMAAWEHARFCRTLRPVDVPRTDRLNWSVWFAAALALVGLLLAAYLVWQSSPHVA